MEHNFNDSPLIPINEVAVIEVHILAEGRKVKGIGAPGLPPLAPAIANAIFSVTGTLIRKMPFNLKMGYHYRCLQPWQRCYIK